MVVVAQAKTKLMLPGSRTLPGCLYLKVSKLPIVSANTHVKKFPWVVLQEEKVCLLRTCCSGKFSLDSSGSSNTQNTLPPLFPKRESLSIKLYRYYVWKGASRGNLSGLQLRDETPAP